MIHHQNLRDKLKKLVESGDTPHIIFYGDNGSGKRTLLNFLITTIYQNTNNKEKHIMYINCAHGKGIRFIRDEVKFFAKTNINNGIFKSIVLYNADKLTIDAQSALRRCIEQFSHTTRFFLIIDENLKLLKPILSRFCLIYVPLPIINKKKTCLHNSEDFINKIPWLVKNLNNKSNYESTKNLSLFISNLYNKGISGINLLNAIEKINTIEQNKKYLLLSYFYEIRSEFRNEKLFMLLILTLTFMRKEIKLENIQEM